MLEKQETQKFTRRNYINSKEMKQKLYKFEGNETEISKEINIQTKLTFLKICLKENF